MRVDPVRNMVIIAMIGAAFALAAALDIARDASRPRVVESNAACPIPEDVTSEALRTLFCTGRLPVNSATAGELERLDGIGPARARAIVAHRERHGPFHCTEDLLEVRGIGPVTVERLEPQIAW